MGGYRHRLGYLSVIVKDNVGADSFVGSSLATPKTNKKIHTLGSSARCFNSTSISWGVSSVGYCRGEDTESVCLSRVHTALSKLT